MKNGQRVEIIRRGYRVLRYHANPTIVPDTIGQHSANVAMLCSILLGEKCTKKLIMYALMHDLAEQWTGDIPYPFKARNPVVKQTLDKAEERFLFVNELDIPTLSGMEYDVFKAADILDLTYAAMDEVTKGNLELKPALETGLRILDGVKLPSSAQAILKELRHDIDYQLRVRRIHFG